MSVKQHSSYPLPINIVNLDEFIEEEIEKRGSGSGPSNIIIGEFTVPNDEGITIGEINPQYTGNGYPIVFFAWLPDGPDDNNRLQRRTILYSICKHNFLIAPDYNGGSNKNTNYAIGSNYTYSSSSSSGIGGGETIEASIYSPYDPSGQIANMVKISSATSIKYWISTGYYGFIPGKTYKYMIMYSE